MTVTSQISTVTFTGNGVTTVFPYTFRIPEDDMGHVGIFDIALSTLTELSPSDYSLSGAGSDFGGSVTYNPLGVPIPSTKRIVIYRELDLVQEMDLTNQSPYLAETLEETLDRIVMMMQQVAEAAGRSIKVTLGSGLTPDEFVADLQEGATVATEAAAAASLSAAAAAASAGAIDLPASPTALNYLRRNAANTAYEKRTVEEAATDLMLRKGANIASAASITIPADGDFHHVTGTTTITAIASRIAGTRVTLVFDGALQLTNDSVNFILLGKANITVAAGDSATFISEGSGVWRMLSLNRLVAPPQERVVKGVVTPAGAVLGGTGFTATNDGTGLVTVTFDTAFANANYAAVASADDGAATVQVRSVTVFSKAVGSFKMKCLNHLPALTDPSSYNFVVIGL